MGNFVWVKTFGVYYYEDYGYSISVDKSGNVYTSGLFKGKVDFDPSINSFFLQSYGSQDGFILKLNSSGGFEWVKRIGGKDQDLIYSLVLDSHKNMYVTGLFERTADMDPGLDSMKLSSAGSYDIFVLKLDSAGGFIWAKQMGGTNNDVGKGIAIDKSGNVVIVGHFSYKADFDPGSLSYIMTSLGYEDAFVVKLNTQGEFIWASSIGGKTSYDDASSVVIDGNSNITLVGNYNGTCDFDPSTNLFNLISNGMDGFSWKLHDSQTVGINDNLTTNMLAVYPNPTSDIIKINSEDIINYTYKVSDQSGRILIGGLIKDNLQLIDIKTLENGVYIFEMFNEKNKVNLKIVKE